MPPPTVGSCFHCRSCLLAAKPSRTHLVMRTHEAAHPNPTKHNKLITNKSDISSIRCEGTAQITPATARPPLCSRRAAVQVASPQVGAWVLVRQLWADSLYSHYSRRAGSGVVSTRVVSVGVDASMHAPSENADVLMAVR